MGERKFYIKFNSGDKYELPASFVAERIVESKNSAKLNRKETRRQIEELLADEFELYEKAWDLSWSSLVAVAKKVNGPDLHQEWKDGKATISVDE